MPDFDLNEGYLQASARRAELSLSGTFDDALATGDLDATRDAWLDAENLIHAESLIDAEGLPGEDLIAGLLDGEGLRMEDFLVGDLTSPQPSGPSPKRPGRTPVVRRARHLAGGHRSTGVPRPGRRIGVQLIARRRRLARRACPFGWTVRVLGTQSHDLRLGHLRTNCRGQSRQAPGSQS
jgi:hypothetical protein